MTEERIQSLANFFYSSNSPNRVPLRLSIMTGQYNGADLTKEDFIGLLKILNNSINLKADLKEFIESIL